MDPKPPSMTGAQVRTARRALEMTQQDLASALRVSQGYVSLLERQYRPVPVHLAETLVSVLKMPATALPTRDTVALTHERTTRALGALGYEGFAYLRGHRLNPAEVLLGALRGVNVDGRVVEALAWLAVTYPALDWGWVLPRAKQEDLQNRLGFVVSLAAGLAELTGNRAAADTLAPWQQRLERSRLQQEGAFSPGTLTTTEARWLREHSSPEAKRWNMLSTLTAQALVHAR